MIIFVKVIEKVCHLLHLLILFLVQVDKQEKYGTHYLVDPLCIFDHLARG